LGERRLCTAEVRGSNPLGSTSGICMFAAKLHRLAAGKMKYQPVLTITNFS
jgi:hypothetical protein